MHIGRSIRLPGKGHVVPHQRAGQTGVGEILIAVKPGRPLQIRIVRIELQVERVVEAAARAPQETDAEFPGRLREFVEAFPRDAEILEEMPREIRCGALTDADHADGLAAHHLHAELGDLAFDGNRGDETGAAATEDEDVLDHGFGFLGSEHKLACGFPFMQHD